MAKPVRLVSSPALTRRGAIRRVRAHLERASFPRFQMALLVGLTGGFGLLSSFGLLRLGVDTMALRYPIALGLAYLFFLCLIGLWLRTTAREVVHALDVPDLPDLPDLSRLADLAPRARGSVDLPPVRSGGGGDFAGGGAGGTFDVPSPWVDDAVQAPLKVAGDKVGAVADADELAIPLLAIVMAVGVALASLYVVYIAPVLFAEVLVDGALSYVLFRRLRAEGGPHWLSTAFRRTALPFAATALLLAAVGAGLAAYAPGAHSIGQVMEQAAAGKASR